MEKDKYFLESPFAQELLKYKPAPETKIAAPIKMDDLYNKIVEMLKYYDDWKQDSYGDWNHKSGLVITPFSTFFSIRKPIEVKYSMFSGSQQQEVANLLGLMAATKLAEKLKI